MPTIIDREVVESYIACPTKGHLRLAGECGSETDYTQLLAAANAEFRERASLMIRRGSDEQTTVGSMATADVLTQGNPLLESATLSVDDLQFRSDALRKMEGRSKIGDFHYAPVLFCPDKAVKNSVRLLAAVCGLLLESVQGLYPSRGFVVHGPNCTVSKVAIDGLIRGKAEKLLDEIKKTRDSKDPPRLTLNNHCHRCVFQQRCQAQAVGLDDLSLLRGMNRKEISRWNKKGIFTVTQLSHTFRPRRNRKRRPRQGHNFSLQALAIREKKTLILGTPTLPSAPVRIYFDVEGDPENRSYFLLGLIVCEPSGERQYSFWADDPKQEEWAFEQFLDVVGRFDDFRLFHYGGFETNYLRYRNRRVGGDPRIERLLANSVNVLGLIYSDVYFPVYHNGLKEIARHLGFSWTDPNASGLQSLVWRRRWETSQEPAVKEMLVRYNLEDCAALKRVTEVLYEILPDANRGTVAQNQSSLGSAIQHVEDIELPRRTWSRLKFQLNDMDFVNGRAYFDYQREKVYVRTDRNLPRKRRGDRVNSRSKRFRINKRIEIEASACPHCGSARIEKGTKLSRKIAFDLRITAGGMWRQIIECIAATYKCRRCDRYFVPSEFKNRSIYMHTLKSWAMHQHVANRVPLRKVVRMFDEFFGLPVSSTYVHMYKAQMALEYAQTYSGLSTRLLSGPLLHVDETRVHLKTGTGYVWVFTSMTDVVYMYRANRETAFLQEMLKPFKGVLVTDFYTGYDGIECEHQKCLIHLIRDLNDELLLNPFDDQLKGIISQFGVLLRATVETIDRHGLKRRHLQKHDRQVERFFSRLDKSDFTTEAAAKVKDRLLKNRDGLFTFVKHDGIPWNNNNAENAIKQFAFYREDTVSIMSEQGLADYLTLLSIAQSCRYRGLSFLRFLMSREKDICEFARSRRGSRAPAQSIEVYAPSFPCPHRLRKRDRDAATRAQAREPRQSAGVARNI